MGRSLSGTVTLKKRSPLHAQVTFAMVALAAMVQPASAGRCSIATCNYATSWQDASGNQVPSTTAMHQKCAGGPSGTQSKCDCHLTKPNAQGSLCNPVATREFQRVFRLQPLLHSSDWLASSRLTGPQHAPCTARDAPPTKVLASASQPTYKRYSVTLHACQHNIPLAMAEVNHSGP